MSKIKKSGLSLLKYTKECGSTTCNKSNATENIQINGNKINLVIKDENANIPNAALVTVSDFSHFFIN